MVRIPKSSVLVPAACICLLAFIAVTGCGRATADGQSAGPAADAESSTDGGPAAARTAQSITSLTATAATSDTELTAMVDESSLAKATFAGGCFWCTEAVFQQVKGVHAVTSGYTGGIMPNPTYQDVLGKMTGHAEAIQITYDPQVVKYPTLLEIFWKTHDPTTMNRQGNDVGPQYRSVVFYHDAEQQRLAELYKKWLDESGAFDAPIVTTIEPAKDFYKAEDYHQNYYRLNSSAGYCAMIIRPKLEKFRQVFKEHLKDAE